LTVAEFERATNTNRIPLKDAVEEFLAEASKKKRPKTVCGYRLNLTQFLDSAKSLKFLDEVSKQTLRGFRDYLAARGYEPRTLHNRVMTVLSLLKEHRILTGFSLTNDLPAFERPVPAGGKLREFQSEQFRHGLDTKTYLRRRDTWALQIPRNCAGKIDASGGD